VGTFRVFVEPPGVDLKRKRNTLPPADLKRTGCRQIKRILCTIPSPFKLIRTIFKPLWIQGRALKNSISEIKLRWKN